MSRNEVMRDITEEYRAEKLDDAAKFEEYAKLWLPEDQWPSKSKAKAIRRLVEKGLNGQ